MNLLGFSCYRFGLSIVFFISVSNVHCFNLLLKIFRLILILTEKQTSRRVSLLESASRLKFEVVKYEDLLENPDRTFRNLFRFFGVRNLDSFVKVSSAKFAEFQKTEDRASQRVKNPEQRDQLQAEKLTEQSRRERVRRSAPDQNDTMVIPRTRKKSYYSHMLEYYGTYRKLNFTHDHWKSELPSEVLNEIQNNTECRRALQLLNYPIHSAIPGNGTS